jgi:GGDEF domain-containing protein
MDTLAAGFWGAFFGAVALTLVGALVAFVRSLHRVALTAAMSAAISALFVVAYLGWLPVGDDAREARLLAHVAVFTTVVLALMLLAMLGLMRRADPAGRRIRAALLATGAGVLVLGWLMEAHHALALSSLMAFTIGAAMLLVCVRSARRGDRLAWTALSGVVVMLVAIGGLSWIAMRRGDVAWGVHAVTATAATAYLAAMASALWSRYSYLIELREVMAHGPAYDPVTRMRSHAEMGQMVGAAFFHKDRERRPVGVVVVSLGNLYALEKLHGRAAVNHALFVLASRMRRSAAAGVEMGRLADDGFLLLMHHAGTAERLAELARQLQRQLLRPIGLSTDRSVPESESARTEWVAEVGIGVLAAAPQVRPSQAVSMARAMSRTAWTYPSRIAWFDPDAAEIAELPRKLPVPRPERVEMQVAG